MKRYTTKELKNILDHINAGGVYVGICNGRGVGKIYAANKSYIRFEHYGGSATKNNTNGIRWIIENIFNDCDLITPAVYSEYHINYIPVDEKYAGIDFSFTHPNVYGL
jgi:hypothetical protein